jgi:hypothetical protein
MATTNIVSVFVSFVKIVFRENFFGVTTTKLHRLPIGKESLQTSPIGLKIIQQNKLV